MSSQPASGDDADDLMHNAKRDLLTLLYETDKCDSIRKRDDGFDVTVTDGELTALLSQLPGWVKSNKRGPSQLNELELTIDLKLYQG